MRVLYLSDRLDRRGGADQHLRQVVEWAVARGAEVRMAYGRPVEGTAPPAGCEGIRIKGLASALPTTRRLARLPELLAWADVVHVQNVMNPEVLTAAAATGRAVVTIQDHRVFCPGAGKTMPDGEACTTVPGDRACRSCLPDVRYRRRTLELTRARLAALAGARLVVLSRYMARELAVVGRADAEVIPPWVEVSARSPESGRHFMVGGRLVHHKGVVVAWRAWRAAEVDLALEVAGAGPLAPRLEGARQHGWLGRRGLQRCLRSARALLFPARWQEPFGILGVEALAQGTPVIVTDVGGVEEWADAGCVRVAPGDTPGIADAIVRLADHPDLAVNLGRRGRDAVARRFARPAVETRLARLYRDISRTSMPGT